MNRARSKEMQPAISCAAMARTAVTRSAARGQGRILCCASELQRIRRLVRSRDPKPHSSSSPPIPGLWRRPHLFHSRRSPLSRACTRRPLRHSGSQQSAGDSACAFHIAQPDIVKLNVLFRLCPSELKDTHLPSPCPSIACLCRRCRSPGGTRCRGSRRWHLAASNTIFCFT